MSFLRVTGIGKRKGNEIILNDIHFSQGAFQNLAICGETGSGKSTLLKIVAGLAQADVGAVYLQNQRVLGSEEKLMPGHKQIAYLSQHFELRNNYTVEEELSYTNKLADKEALAIFSVCRIDHLLKRKTDQLSGGERQRIVLARLLISAPKLLLLDEPFSNLDMMNKNIIKSVLLDISSVLGITCLLVSHDPLDILSWADCILVLKDGQVQQVGAPQQIYRHPVNEYAAGLFGRYNLITPVLAETLAAVVDIKINGLNIIIRPEQIRIVGEGEGYLRGTVVGTDYFGSYTELHVMVAGGVLLVRSWGNNYASGDSIHLSLTEEDLTYVH